MIFYVEAWFGLATEGAREKRAKHCADCNFYILYFQFLCCFDLSVPFSSLHIICVICVFVFLFLPFFTCSLMNCIHNRCYFSSELTLCVCLCANVCGGKIQFRIRW